MIRTLLVAAMLMTASACERGSQKSAEAPKTETTPRIGDACNDVALNPAISAQPPAGALATPALANLLGGDITPGVYDLQRIDQLDGAPAQTAPVWQALQVRDSEQGPLFEFVTARGSATAQTVRASARLEEDTNPATLVYTCGRSGQTAVAWEANAEGLQLRLPAEGGTGQTLYVYARRRS